MTTGSNRRTYRTPIGRPIAGSSRRQFLRQVGLSALAVGPASAFLAGCATGGDDDENNAETGEKSVENPLGVPEDVALEIYIFNGGLGDAYATEVHQPMYQKAYPDATIEHHAEVDIAGTLQTRFVKGNPPDFVNDSGEGQIPLGQLVDNDQLYDLTALFDAPSWDDPDVKVRDTLTPGAIEVGTFGGTPYVLNYASTVFGLWYNKTLFDDHGWTPPTTWDDMLALCEEIKGAGIAPWTYQGDAPRYMNWPLLTMAAKLAGPEILVALDNLEEGAWGHEAIKESAAALQGLRDKGYILEDTEGMTFTQAQKQWSDGKAAIIPSGTWLENEQAEVTPEGFEFAMFPEPLLSSDAAMPAETLRATAGEPYIVPSAAKNPNGALEYMRIMLSQEGARGFTEQTSSLTIVEGSAEGLELPPGLVSAKTALEAAGDNVVDWLYLTWYREMENPGIDSATGDLMAGRVSVDEWVDACEAEAAKIRDDDAITKYTR